MKSEKGQAMVETALILPILIILLFGVVDFSRAFHAYLTLDHAGREAARLASVGSDDADIDGKIASSISGLDASKLAIVYPKGIANRPSGTDVKITLTYTFKFVTPLVNFLVKKFDTEINIVDETVMRVE